MKIVSSIQILNRKVKLEITAPIGETFKKVQNLMK